MATSHNLWDPQWVTQEGRFSPYGKFNQSSAALRKKAPPGTIRKYIRGLKLQYRPVANTVKLVVGGETQVLNRDYTLEGDEVWMIYNITYYTRWRISYKKEEWEDRARRLWV